MKVVLAGVVKNIESYALTILDFIVQLKLKIPQLQVVIYENNSTDKTKEFLNELSAKSDFIHTKCEDYTNTYFLEKGRANTWDNLPCRMEVIAHARNKLLDMLEQFRLDSGDIIIMTDLDFHKSPDVEVIKHIVGNFPAQADALFANGIDNIGQYYDAFILRTEAHPFGPEIIGDEFRKSSHMGKLLTPIKPTDPLKPVYSAFGGLGIYRADAIIGCRYSAHITDDVHAYYTSTGAEKVIDCTVPRESYTHYKGALLGSFLKDNKIFYKNNSGYNWPIIGEHVPFHMAMRAKGRGKFFIVPQMLYYH
jgi:hypothetical protein